MYHFIRPRHLLSLCFAFVVLVSSCGSEKIWEMDGKVVEETLRRGAYAFLEEISFQEVDPGEIHRLGPGSATAMALVFTRIGRLDEAREMLEAEWESGEEPWKGDAGFSLAERCLEREEYLRCLPLAEELVAEYGNYRAYRILLETRYWLLENSSSLEILDEIKERFPESAAYDDELLLFEAAAASRLGREGWQSDFSRLFLTVPAGELHVRALDYLRLSGLFPGGFDSLERNLFEMKYSAAAGLYRAGTERAGDFLAEADPAVLNDVVLEDITLLFLLSGEPLEGYRLLNPLFAEERYGKYGGLSPVKLAEVTGRLLRKAGLCREAIERFGKGLEVADVGPSGDARIIDRLLWFRADCYFELGPEHLVGHLPELVMRWNSPGYFTDLLDELGTALTASGRWEMVHRAWRILRDRGVEEAAARLAYILLRTTGLRAADPDDTDLLVEDAVRPEAGRYYPLLAGFLTGREFQFPDAPREGDSVDASAPSVDPEGLPYESLRVIKLMEFGLLLEAFEEAKREKVDLPLLLELRRRLEAQGFYREAVLCGEAALEADVGRDLGMIYPLYFAGPVNELVAEYPIPEPLLYALMREESYFDSRIVSRAGAVGLTQLMPATAAEMAMRLDIDKYDVFDPQTNILFGGYYFYTLLRRFPTPAHAVSAYNAGPTRVRRWERSFGSLPADLFIEAIPFRETRNHCRKVLVSAVHYGYLYGDLEPGEVITTFFPELTE